MKKPVVRYLVASPYGDVPIENDRLDFPLEADPLKTPYRVYFHSIRKFLMRNNCLPLLHSLNKIPPKDLKINKIDEIIIRTEKHGALYHPASIDLVCMLNRIKFGLNVAVTDAGKDSLKREFALMKSLHEKFQLPFIPQPYFLDELDSMVFLGEEWFESYHEFHIAETEDGGHKMKLWEYGKGDRFLSPAQSFEIYQQAAMILTLYYDINHFRVIYPWHHAAGDFVVRISPNKNPPLGKGDREGFPKEKINVRLTTVRGYEPFLSADEDLVPPALALFYFLLHLSIQMRLDKLDGVGDIVWADETCIDATFAGFFQALKTKNDFIDSISSTQSFLNLLKSFTRDDLKKTFGTVAVQFEQTRDFNIVEKNLEDHIERFYLTLQNFP